MLCPSTGIRITCKEQGNSQISINQKLSWRTFWKSLHKARPVFKGTKLKQLYIEVGLPFHSILVKTFYLEIANSCSLPKDKDGLVFQKVNECCQKIFCNKLVKIL